MNQKELERYILDLYGEETWEYVQLNRGDILSENIGRRRMSDELEGLTESQARNIVEKVRDSAGEEEYSAEEIIHSEKIGQWVDTQSYVYNPDRDIYIITTNDNPFNEFGESPVIPGTKVRSLVQMYSSYNEGATINECAKRLEYPRRLVEGLLKVLGVTHDSEPVTREQLEETPIDDLVDSHFQRKRYQFEREVNKQQWKQTQKNAKKFKRLKHLALDPIKQFLGDVEIETTSTKYKGVPVAVDHYPPQASFVNYYDFHYYGWSSRRTGGEEWNAELAEEELFRHLDWLADQLMFFNVDKIFLPIGNDVFQVDTAGKTTTRGTPVDMDGSPQEMVMDGIKLHVDVINKLRKVGNVELLHVPGNHDNLLSTALYGALMTAFRDAEDVTAREDIRSRQYRRFGNTLFMATHGDKLTKKKIRKLPNIMAKEDGRFSQTDCHMVFTGHKHQELIRDVNGVLVCQTPCLCSTNKYEYDNFWTGGRDAFSSWIIHPENGATNYLVNPKYN